MVTLLIACLVMAFPLVPAVLAQEPPARQVASERARAGLDAPKLADVDDFIRAEMRAQNIPGLSLAVVQDGRVVQAAGYGFADRQRKVPATPDTVYKIASVSKQFVAAGIMLLVQEARLGVDDPVSRYLEGTPASWKAITIRHLLTHTSGLVREGPAFDAKRSQPDAEVIRSAFRLPLQFTPGARHDYGNLNYFALAEIIRVVSGVPWTDFISDRIFKPTGMTSTWPTNTQATIPNRATGYVDNDRLRVADQWPALRPSGGFLSTVLDLAKWDAALYGDGILHESTRRQMWTPVTLNDGSTYPYGLGWQLGTFRGQRFVRHTGGMPGARAMFVRFPDAGLAIVILMNLDDVDPIGIAEGVAVRYLGGTP